MEFSYERETKLELTAALARIKGELARRGFGVLWELDVPAKLAEKGVQYDGDFRILEICNPHDAKRALETDPTVGYFLPCKIVLYRRGERTVVGMPKPTFLMNALGGGLADLAARVETELKGAIDALDGQD